MQSASTPGSEARELWYELGRLYSINTGSKNRATMLAFTIVCVVGALVLLSGYFIGTARAGTATIRALGAATIPLTVGLVGGVVVFGGRRIKLRRQEKLVKEALAAEGEDPERPTRDGLEAYYDAQLVLIRSEYEFLRLKGYSMEARLLEEAFGFSPEDSFETGPLNVSPDSGEMQVLRETWETRISTRRQDGSAPPMLGLKEDLAYHVFPREMTVPVELAARRAYLEISYRFIKNRYGTKPFRKPGSLPKELQLRIEKDLGEYAALTRKSA